MIDENELQEHIDFATAGMMSLVPELAGLSDAALNFIGRFRQKAIEDEREACIKDVCPRCRANEAVEWRPFQRGLPETWMHRNCKMTGLPVECAAANIRNRAAVQDLGREGGHER